MPVHIKAMQLCFSNFWRTPIGNLMTISVIAIALALPASLTILLQNVKIITSGWNEDAPISLYLKPAVAEENIQQLLQQLTKDPAVSKVLYITPKQGLEELQKESLFAEVLTKIKDNPLPAVIAITPIAGLDSTHLNDLMARLKLIPEIEIAEFDLAWIKRLYALMDLAKDILWVLGGVFGLAIILIIGNTLRLAVENSRNEIEVLKLLGATKAYICRPFVYTGLFYGVSGGFFAFCLLGLFCLAIAKPFNRLVSLYQSGFYFQGPTFTDFLFLTLVGAVLGLVGARYAVGRQIRTLEPQ